MPSGTMQRPDGDSGKNTSRPDNGGGKGGARPPKKRTAGAGLRRSTSSLKLFDGKPTIREEFYQRALQFIVDVTDDRTPANLIASEALAAAGVSVIAPDEATERLEEAAIAAGRK